jgi:hypothetical protein
MTEDVLNKTYANGWWSDSGGGTVGYSEEWSYWNQDTNAFTALEVTTYGGGPIASGQCSLYGLN